ncbi:XRE family transcriptional regulator [Corallococcus praedator]|uniref:XRE family transcriptional regulator n=2 Tax=Corallococcus TaxID=83461 RepID=A0ABX9QS28_9BACT|nr:MULTISPECIES: helix-turn-helix transcriptional regulator [Corallococcus]RKH21154.1 XRE family transcriptional regulator [Corallococcus sp. CA047B]RKH35892.1 XRE family transcriptional regulator [Corallococcus sp. CA031C]RKI17644.1 XRE family transcriptional regulator [Corallococcus praedator]
MNTNTLPGPASTLGGFLRDRRARLAPEPGAPSRRRTPGLRREEVATRAGVSVTWYTWLEQGRGGPPSDEVLERLARALELDAAGREVLYLLAQQRPPPLRAAPLPPVAPALQRVLDALPTSPAYVQTPAWDIVAWNAAATVVLSDYAAMPAHERNVIRRLFGPSAMRASLPDWEAHARFALATFRVDAARAGDCPEAAALAAELQETSAEFRRLWAENEMRSHGSGLKRIQHPLAGPLTLEYSAFAVDSGNGLRMVVFTPASPADARAIATLLSDRARTV